MANCAPNSSDGRSPLMEAVASGSIAACEYLLLNGAKLDAVDATGRRTALHHATILGHTGQVCQFLKRGTWVPSVLAIAPISCSHELPRFYFNVL